MWRIFLIVILFVIEGVIGNAQTLLIEEDIHSNITVCDSTSLTYRLFNSYDQDLANASVQLTLPAGIFYVAGSVVNAREIDISDLQNPIFQKGNIPAGQPDSIVLMVAASCEARAKEGQKFINRVVIEHPNGKQLFESHPPYSIRTAHLIIEDVHPLDTTITAMHSATRYISIQNTRIGRLKQFAFRDVHTPGIIELSQGQTIQSTNTLLEAIIGADAFKKIGNGDAYFDYGERIVLREYISLDSCSTAIVNSDISVEWGCRGEACQSDRLTDLIVEVKEVVERANLTLKIEAKAPSCPCNEAEQKLTICNDGLSTATDILLRLDQTTNQPNGLLDQPLWLTRGTDTLPIGLPKKYRMKCEGIYDSLVLALPDLEEGKCYVLHETFTNCANQEGEKIHEPQTLAWESKLTYSTLCLDGRQDSVSIRVRKENNIPLRTIVTQTNEIYKDGDRVSIQFRIISRAFTRYKHGQITVRYIAPCGFVALQDEFVLGGRRPFLTYDSISGSGDHITLTSFKLPFRRDSLNGYLSLRLECDTPCLKREGLVEELVLESSCTEANTGGKLKSFSEHCVEFVLSDCPLETFDDFCGYAAGGFSSLTSFKCNSGDTLIQTTPGYVDFSGDIERLSRGYADQDNDRIADLPLTRASRSEVDHHRYLENDTMRLHYTGMVVSDTPGTKYNRLFVAPEINENVLSFVRSGIRIVDHSTGRVYECTSDSIGSLIVNGSSTVQCGTNIIPPVNSIDNALIYHPSYLKELECVPEDFDFEEGDSLYIYVDYSVNIKVKYQHNTGSTINSGIFLFSDEYEHYPFSCGSYSDMFHVGRLSYNVETSAEPPLILACQDPNTADYYHLSMNAGMANYFPYEYRPLMHLDDITYHIDPAVTLDSIALLYYYPDSPQPSPVIHRIRTIPESPAGNGDWRLPGTLNYVLDEAYNIYILPYISVKDCHDLAAGFTDTSQQIRCITQSQSPYFYFYNLNNTKINRHLWRNKYEIDPQGDYNLFKMDIPASQLVSNTDKGKWKARILKRDSALREVRFKILQKSSDLDLIHIRDNLGNVYPEQDGIISIRPFGDSISELTITATDLSCDWQYLQLISAWTCDTVGDFFERACSIDTFNLSMITLPPEMEMNTTTSDVPFDLCDTMRHIEVNVWNADRGAAFDVELMMTLPLGFTLLEDEIMYAFDNSNNFIPMPLPEKISPGQYRWKLNERIEPYQQEGWPGVDLPNSILTIRLSGLLDCNFSSGTFLHFNVKGRNNCYEPTNIVARNSLPIKINNADPLSKFISFNPSYLQPNLFLCRSTGELTVNMFATKPFSPGDKIQIILPQGLRYVPGSIQGISHFTPLPPNVITVGGRTLLVWNSTEVADGFLDISFSIQVESQPDELQCSEYEIQIQGTHSSQAVCVTTGDICDVDVVEGAESVLFNVDKGHIRTLLLDSLYTINDSTIHLCFRLAGSWGNQPKWTDSLFFNLYGDRRGDGRTEDDISLGTFGIWDTLIREDTMEWCIDVSGQLPEEFCYFILEIPDSNNCICAPATGSIIHYPPDLSFIDTLCPRAEVTLGVTDVAGARYQWVGTDVDCPDCAQISVRHTFDNDTVFRRQYFLEVLDDRNCAQVIHYTVVFLPVITPDLVEYTLCIGDSITLAVEGVRTARWEGPALESPLSGTPVVAHPTGSGTWQLTFVDSNHCTGMAPFEVDVLKVDPSDYEISGDTAILPGGTAHLWISGPGTFEWDPAASLTCTYCDRVDATPDSTTTYSVIIVDKNGCEDTLKVTVTVLPPPCDPSIVFVPNAFSPNGDGVNDLLYVRGNFIDTIEFVLYDRWGEKIFETRDIDIPWDGTYRGESLTTDVYSYYLKVRCTGGEAFIKTGNITLLR